MEYREEITPEMQVKWFESVDTISNNYFIIRVNGEKVGLIYGSQIDWNKKETGNGGIFIWDTKWHESPLPLQATFILIELTFLLGLERTFVKVLRDNSRAIRFNQDLGYRLADGQEDVINQTYVLSQSEYLRKTDRVRKALANQYSDVLTITFDQPEAEAELFLLQRLQQLNDVNSKRVILKQA